MAVEDTMGNFSAVLSELEEAVSYATSHVPGRTSLGHWGQTGLERPYKRTPRLRGKPWIAVVIPVETLSLKILEVVPQCVLSRLDPSIVPLRMALSEVDNFSTR